MLKIITFNIRLDNGNDGINNFTNRKGMILRALEREKADVICFQEVLPHVNAWLKECLTDYITVGCGRSRELLDEATVIAFRKDKFDLIQMDTNWLSDTPEIPGSRYEDQSECPRTCTSVLLYSREQQNVMRIYNTHLDHIGSGARIKGMSQILRKMESEKMLGEVPVIIVGDMNALPDDPEIKMVTEEWDMKDVSENIDFSFHDYGDSRNFEKIDYIFVSAGINAEKCYLLKDEENGVYLSDHYPIAAELDIKQSL